MIKTNLQKEDKYKVGVYSLINQDAGLSYSGSGILGKCLSRHSNGYDKGNHINYKVRRAFKEYPDGWEFLALPIEEPGFTKEENRELAFDLEQADIDQFIGTPGFLNIAVDARNCCPMGSLRSDETKEKMSKHKSETHKLAMSKAKTGRPLSDSHKLAISKANIGRPVSESARLAISLASIGKPKCPMSDSHKQALSKAKTSKIISDSHKQALSKALTGKPKGPMSDSHKLAISKAHTGMKYIRGN